MVFRRTILSILMLPLLLGAALVQAQDAPPAPRPDTEQAQPQDAPPAEIADRGQALELLNHRDYATRERAQTYLLQDESLDRPALRELLQQASTPEQRQRLIAIAEHHVLRLAREQRFGVDPDAPKFIRPASVGFSYNALLPDENPLAHRVGLIVKATMPGFPAFAHLKPGDIIVRVDGQDVPDFNNFNNNATRWLSGRISRYQAGATMRFGVMRNGEPVDLTLVCAERAALDQMYENDALNAAVRAEPFNRLWLQARQELTAALPGPTELARPE